MVKLDLSRGKLPDSGMTVAWHLCCSEACREQLLIVTAERDALAEALRGLSGSATKNCAELLHHPKHWPTCEESSASPGPTYETTSSVPFSPQDFEKDEEESESISAPRHPGRRDGRRIVLAGSDVDCPELPGAEATMGTSNAAQAGREESSSPNELGSPAALFRRSREGRVNPSAFPHRSRRAVLCDSDEEATLYPSQQHPQEEINSPKELNRRIPTQRVSFGISPGPSGIRRTQTKVISLLSDSEEEDQAPGMNGRCSSFVPSDSRSHQPTLPQLPNTSSALHEGKPSRRCDAKNSTNGASNSDVSNSSSDDSDSDLDGFIVPDSCSEADASDFSPSSCCSSYDDDSDSERCDARAGGLRELEKQRSPANKSRVFDRKPHAMHPVAGEDSGMTDSHGPCKPSILINSTTDVHAPVTPSKPVSAQGRALTPSWTQQKRNLRGLAPRLFQEYNKLAFGGQLPAGLPIVWNAKLRRTAGYCAFITRGGQREARIELSEKILDSEERLRKTLAHEMCHAAQWLVDGSSKPPHGAIFWSWAKKVEERIYDMKITTCHSYDIYYKFRYKCLGCSNTFGRQTKSIDIARQCCAACKGKLTFLGAFNRDGSEIRPRGPTPFAQYVKANFAAVKKTLPNASHKEVMAELAQRWKSGRKDPNEENFGNEDNVAQLFDDALRL